MRRVAIAVSVALLFGASAAWSQGGVNLAWTDCGIHGTPNLSFACDTNSGPPLSLIASYYSPVALPEFLGLTGRIDLRNDFLDPLPDWWKHGRDYCRGTTGLAVSFDFTNGPVQCLDFFMGQATGGFAYDYPEGVGANRASLRVTCAVPFDLRGPIEPDLEYYAFEVNLLRAKTTGAGSCAGCATRMCIALNEIQLFQPPEQQHDPTIQNPADRSFVTFQGASPICFTVPAVSRTWGQVRSLYR
jgi:hypothetical protein